MSTALAKPEASAPVVTSEQLDLIRKTIAKDATADELKLYLYDCQRQGVHPLDKLLIFTKRSNRYTPITSIDFMRIRAAETGEYAGSDDPTYDDADGYPDKAHVTVWRLVQGQRYAFAATARWSEYKPEQNDFMWKRMPYTMLGKCAEALALRKGFPRQLAGLYAAEEMDQANSRTTFVEAPALAARTEVAAASLSEPAQPSAPNGGGSGTSPQGVVSHAPASQPPATRDTRSEPLAPSGGDSGQQLPPGTTLITRTDGPNGTAKGFLYTTEHPFHGGGEGIAIYKEPLVKIAEQCCQDRIPVMLTIATSATSGKKYVKEIQRLKDLPF